MIHVAMIGAGAIADSHMEGFLAFPNECKIIAVVDKRLDKAEQKIKRHGLSAVAVSDVEALRDLPVQADLASVCLPPSLHAEVTVSLLEKGMHVLCEKPLACSLEECDRMIDAAKKHRRILSTVAQNRFKPDVRRVKALCDSGLLGRKLAAVATSLWWRGENYYNLSWRGKWETEGGGCTLIHGIHHIDLLLWLMGDVASITAMVDNQAHTNSEVEDISMSMIRFQSGAVGTMVSSLLHHGEEQRLMVDAEHGSVELPLAFASNAQLENGFPRADEALQKKIRDCLDAANVGHTGHTGQIEDMLHAISHHHAPMVTGEDGRRVIEFVMATYQSAFTNTTVKLPMTPSDLFYTKRGVDSSATKFYQKTVSVDQFVNDSIQVGGTL